MGVGLLLSPWQTIKTVAVCGGNRSVNLTRTHGYQKPWVLKHLAINVTGRLLIRLLCVFASRSWVA